MPKKTHNPIFAMALMAIVAMLLVACGESDSPTAGKTASSEHIVKSTDRISATSSAPSEAQFPEGEESDEVSPTGAGPVRPCSFVRRDEASAILGAPVQVTTGKLGPTCIYETPGSPRAMTLVVQIGRASCRERV